MNDLLDLLDAWQSSKPRSAAATVTGTATTESMATGNATIGQGETLRVTTSRYFPTPTYLPPGSSNADPEAPDGAQEVLSVTQIAGASVAYTPIGTRTYPVRGSIV